MGTEKVLNVGLLGMRGWLPFTYLLVALLKTIESVCPLKVGGTTLVVLIITLEVLSFTIQGSGVRKT